MYAYYIKLLHKLQECIFKYNLRVRSTYAQIARDFHYIPRPRAQFLQMEFAHNSP